MYITSRYSRAQRTQEEADKAKVEAKAFNEALLASAAKAIAPLKLEPHPHHPAHRAITLTPSRKAEVKTDRDGDGRIKRLDLIAPNSWRAYGRYPVKKDGTISLDRFAQDVRDLQGSAVAADANEAYIAERKAEAKPAFERVREAHEAAGRPLHGLEMNADPKLPIRITLRGSYSEATALRLIAALKETT